MLKKCPRCGVQYTKEALEMFETTVKAGFTINLTCGNCGAAMVVDESQVADAQRSARGRIHPQHVAVALDKSATNTTATYDNTIREDEPGDFAAGCSFGLLTLVLMIFIWWKPLGDLSFWIKCLLSLASFAIAVNVGLKVGSIVNMKEKKKISESPDANTIAKREATCSGPSNSRELNEAEPQYVNCPHCEGQVLADAVHDGENTCPHCEAVFKVRYE